MSDRWGPFSGRQLTTIILGTVAIVASSAVGAVATSAVNPFSYVALQDPVSGNKAAIDVSRRVQVYDALQAASANPATFFEAQGTSFDGCSTVYTVPANRGAVVQSAIVNVFTIGATGNGNYVRLTHESSPWNTIEANPATVGGTGYQLTPGVALHAGENLSVCTGGSVRAQIQVKGYLVPAAWVPSPPMVASAAQR
jgi:hypothetical protein